MAREHDMFLELLIAAMKDASGSEMKLTQLQFQLDLDGSGVMRKGRIIVVPEEMEYKKPDGSPFGQGHKVNPKG